MSNSKSVLDEPRKLVFPDESGHGNHLKFQINWNKRVKNCGYLKFFFPDGKECIVKKDYFRSIMMFLANEEEIMSQARQRVNTVREVQKIYTIKLHRNFKAGESINIPVKIQIPVDIRDRVLDLKEGFKGR